MDWMTDPAIWVGLLTLVTLEIVLGVDNLIFLAILSDKLPPAQRERARIIGLSLALFMRLALLASITWVMSLTAPVFAFWRIEVSWRDLILIAGGVFLLVKATTEIHERIEARPAVHGASGGAAFWPIVAQIVVLDAVFSLDSVITAVGMVDELYVMMAAVIIAVIAMLIASRPLTAFITARPSLIILCLGFLLMVGLVLVVDGLGVHVPKGYVYAAIGFSLLIEVLNQLAARGRRKAGASLPPRQRVADAVLKLLGGVRATVPEVGGEVGVEVFQPAQRDMVNAVLQLADRQVSTIMTPRERVGWLDAATDAGGLRDKVRGSPHREFPVGRGSLDDIVGVVRKEDILSGTQTLQDLLKPAVRVQADATVLDTLALFKKQPIELALVVDATSRMLGVVTRTDLLQAIAGELPALP
jgi:predicted tellurium resistance membrane protein TerC